MSISQEELKKMLQDEYLDAAERLRIWVETAQEELRGEEEKWDDIYAMLFWSQTEFHRRRKYLNLSTPPLEIEGSQTLRAMESRQREKSEKKGFIL